jgi:hypothetical protein
MATSDKLPTFEQIWQPTPAKPTKRPKPRKGQRKGRKGK